MSIEYETEDHVARITINRPRAMNAIDRAHKTDDALEGATAFAEKRAPRFKGR